ncbi:MULTISPECIES: YceI family protein [Mesorhizobium]|uniref:YceI family protein n=1 Tax=Mesorhizobium TaxID=68287 RepID=UPI0010A96BC0|nr:MULTISPECIES: YceI family protein [Mesorhizobium]
MFLKVSLVAIALWTATHVSPSFAGDTYRIDPEHVSLMFSMQHDKWAKYQGTIRTIKGEIFFDKVDVANSSVKVEMATGSVDTLDKARDSELQGNNGFLDGTQFPKISFESTKVEKTGDKSGKIVGNLSMAGVTKPVPLDVTFDGEAISNWDGQMRVGFSATGKLNTNDFGMTGLAALDIGPVLDFAIEVEATKSQF